MGVWSGGMGSNSLTEPHEAIGLGAEFVAIWDQHLAAEEMQTAFDAMMEYLATGRRILEAPAAACDAKPCSTVSSVTSTTTTTAEGSTSTTTITTISCPEKAA